MEIDLYYIIYSYILLVKLHRPTKLDIATNYEIQGRKAHHHYCTRFVSSILLYYCMHETKTIK